MLPKMPGAGRLTLKPFSAGIASSWASRASVSRPLMARQHEQSRRLHPTHASTSLNSVLNRPSAVDAGITEH